MAGFWVMTERASYALCRVTIAFIWFYHGLVPKLLGPHPDELAMNMAMGLSPLNASRLAVLGGVLEILFALLILLCWRQRWPLQLTVAAMVALLVFAAVAQPALLAGAFNPLTTNLAVLVLAVLALPLQGKPIDDRS